MVVRVVTCPPPIRPDPKLFSPIEGNRKVISEGISIKKEIMFWKWLFSHILQLSRMPSLLPLAWNTPEVVGILGVGMGISSLGWGLVLFTNFFTHKLYPGAYVWLLSAGLAMTVLFVARAFWLNEYKKKVRELSGSIKSS